MRFFSLIRPLALVAALALTIRAQAFWQTDDFFAMFIPVVLWLGLIIDWVMRQIRRQQRGDRIERREWALPVCLALVFMLGITHIPLRIMCWAQLQTTEKQLLAWSQKGALQKVGKHAPAKTGFDVNLAFGSAHHPFQIARSQGDTRFFLWENKPNLSVRTAIGFAYCPGDAGCGRASFWDYWDYSGDSPEHLNPPVEYYWDYSHGAPQYVSLGNDWYATKVSVEDVGD